MTTQSNYTPEVVQLQGGLDLVTPRPVAAPGALIDCYNFEVSDILGYSRVLGCERYDGRHSQSLCYSELYALTITAPNPLTLSTPFPCYNIGANSQNAFGICTSYVSDTSQGGLYTLYVYVTNFHEFYKLYSNVFLGSGLFSQDGTTTNEITVSKVTNIGTYPGASLATCISTIVSQYTVISNKVEQLGTSSQSGSVTQYNPAVGLNWYKNQLYAIADLNSFYFTNGNSTVTVGDILSNSYNATNIIVRDINVVSGTWGGSNAQGVIWYSLAFPGTSNVGNYNSATFGTANTPAIWTVGTTFNILRNGTTITDALQAGSPSSLAAVPPTNYAGIYRAWNLDNLPVGSPYSYQGWQELDLGYLVQFTGGTSNGPPPVPGRVSIPTPSQVSNTAGANLTVGVDGAGNAPNSGLSAWKTGTGTWTIGGLTSWPTAVQQASAFTANGGSGTFSGEWVIPNTISIGNNPPTGGADPLYITGFSFPDLPNDVLINGIEVGIAGAVDTLTGAHSRFNAQLVLENIPTGSWKATGAIASTNPTTPTQFTLGGAGDFWGVGALTPQQLTDGNFGVAVYVSADSNPTSTYRVMCGLYIKVYFQSSSSIYYFWNGTNDIQATIVTSFLTSGNWTTNNGAGLIHVANLQPVGSANRLSIGAGDQIRTQPGGVGNLLANVSASMVYAGLPSLYNMQQNSSQYEMITANFYGNKDWDALYGVSGAGRAFTYDGFYFRYIYTGLNNTLDTPRHVAFHNFHLCLGYQAGSIFTSVTGSPESFDGTLGAVEFDTGDAVTGLLRMNGTTLGVFCQKSIWGLNGTDNTNFSLNILSPYEGAIEYTVVDCGQTVYASQKGISIFDQTAAYGSFLGTRLSSTITPFLLPRLTNVGQQVPVAIGYPPSNVLPTTAVDNSVAFAMPIRDKNQYRLWFKDGYILTITFSGANLDQPSATIQRIDFGRQRHGEDPGTIDVLIPLAHSSSIDNNGLDRNHVSYYSPIQGLARDSFDNKNYVWELNRGWGFGTRPIIAYFTTTHNFFQNPFQIANIRKIRLHGQSLGAGSLAVAVSADYLSRDFEYGNLYGQVQSNAVPQDISLPRGWNASTVSSATLSTIYQSETNIANVSKEGRSFSMQFSTNPSSIEPPTIAQALLIQITENKADI